MAEIVKNRNIFDSFFAIISNLYISKLNRSTFKVTDIFSYYEDEYIEIVFNFEEDGGFILLNLPIGNPANI